MCDPTNHELITTFLDIQDRHRKRMDTRMAYGWKLGLAFWSGLAILICSVLTKSGSSIPFSFQGWMGWACAITGLAALVTYGVWILNSGIKNLDDQGQARAYMDALEDTIRANNAITEGALRAALAKYQKRKNKPGRYRACRYSRWFLTWAGQLLQIAITLSLVIGLVAVWRGRMVVNPQASDRTCVGQCRQSESPTTRKHRFRRYHDGRRCIGNDRRRYRPRPKAGSTRPARPQPSG